MSDSAVEMGSREGYDGNSGFSPGGTFHAPSQACAPAVLFLPRGGFDDCQTV